MTMDAARSLAVQLVLSPTHRVGKRCGFRSSRPCVVLLPDDDALGAPDKCTDPRAGETFGEMQSRPMTELEGLLPGSQRLLRSSGADGGAGRKAG